MIKFSLNDDIQVGDTVRYTETEVDFNHIDDYTGEFHSEQVDVSGVTGTVLSVSNSVSFNLCQVEFSDTSFLPLLLRQDKIWYVNKDLLEKV
jgi:hypothetical protein